MKLLNIIILNLPIPLSRVPRLLFYLLINLFSLPFKWMENLVFGRKIRKQEIHTSPVFILGHWRSGTTFLHGLLSQDRQFGYVNFYNAIFPTSFLWTENRMKPLLNKLAKYKGLKIPYFNNVEFDFDYPCEEDTALLNMNSRQSAYWAYSFPEKALSLFSKTMYFTGVDSKRESDFTADYLYFLKKISYKYKGKRLLLKSPPNTARIKLLLKLFPDAKFIHISRNPVELYYSHRKLWEQNMRQFSLQKIDSAQLDIVIIQTMRNVLKQYQEDKNILDRGNLYEISYDRLKSDPMAVLKEVYGNLGLPGFSAVENNFKDYLEKSQSYKTYAYEFDTEKVKWIEENMAELNSLPEIPYNHDK